MASIQDKVEQDPFITCRRIKEGLQPELADVSIRTVSRRVHVDLDFISYRARHKPILTEAQTLKRLRFAEQYGNWDKQQWRSVVWADESQFQVTGNNPRYCYRHKDQDAYDPKFCIGTSAQPSRQMAWGCFSYSGVGRLVFLEKGSITGVKYKDLLEENLQASFGQMGTTSRRVIFVHDGAPVHTSKVVKQYLADRHIEMLEFWPSSSPDINPIENIWGYIKKKLQNRVLANKEDMRAEVSNLWNSIPKSHMEKIVDSMPGRLREVIYRNGKHTKY